jgi:hypothetical protein
MNKSELDQAREEGLRRYQIIVPLLAEGLAECEKRQIRRQICDRDGLSRRTLRRWLRWPTAQGKERQRKLQGYSGGGFADSGRVAAGTTGAQRPAGAAAFGR